MLTESRITITSALYEQLKEDSLTLEALNKTGVAGWEKYSEAMFLLEELREEEKKE